MCITACSEPAFLAKLQPKPDLNKNIFSLQCLSLFSYTCSALHFRLSSRCRSILANVFSSSHSFMIVSYCSLASSGTFKGDLQQSLPPSVTANRKLICGTKLRPTRRAQTGAFSRCMSKKSELSSLRSSCTPRWFENMQDFEYFVRKSYKLCTKSQTSISILKRTIWVVLPNPALPFGTYWNREHFV